MHFLEVVHFRALSDTILCKNHPADVGICKVQICVYVRYRCGYMYGTDVCICKVQMCVYVRYIEDTHEYIYGTHECMCQIHVRICKVPTGGTHEYICKIHVRICKVHTSKRTKHLSICKVQTSKRDILTTVRTSVCVRYMCNM